MQLFRGLLSAVEAWLDGMGPSNAIARAACSEFHGPGDPLPTLVAWSLIVLVIKAQGRGPCTWIRRNPRDSVIRGSRAAAPPPPSHPAPHPAPPRRAAAPAPPRAASRPACAWHSRTAAPSARCAAR
ncbi:MAG: hypothetical protein EBU31_12005 [Proteobacteria bacterium]|nr:hypothetical protein [Pseudomonadota bacterium]